jgi:hypothetical protein
MHIRIVKTGEEAHVTPDTSTWIFLRSGLIEEVPKTKQKPGTNFVLQQKRPEGIAVKSLTWWVEGEGRKDAAICCYCDVCKFKNQVYDADYKVRAEHCGKTEFVPDAIMKQYEKARSIFR